MSTKLNKFYDVHLFDTDNSLLTVFAKLTNSEADNICRRKRHPLQSTYKVLSLTPGENSDTAVRYNDTGDIMFPGRHRTSKVNMINKRRNLDRINPHEEKAKQIYDYYQAIVSNDPDRKIVIHLYAMPIRDGGYLEMHLNRLAKEYAPRVYLVHLDHNGAIIPDNEPVIGPQIPKTKQDKIKEYINDLTLDFIPIVKAIERDTPMVTQNHYGKYLSIFSTCCNGPTDSMVLIVAAALLDSGANSAGVASALKIYRGK